jgi:hypothetical protein
MPRYWLFLLFLLCWAVAKSDAARTIDSMCDTLRSGLCGHVRDAVSHRDLPARVVCRNQNGVVYGSYYKNQVEGFFTQDGFFQIPLPPGEYEVEIFHGMDYLSQNRRIVIAEDQVVKQTFDLDHWLPLRKLGWINGDGHAHLYTDKRCDDDMLTTVRTICLAQGVDFLCSNQGWAGYDDDTWRHGYDKFSDRDFKLYYGAEMPKYRTGHIWWLGLKSTHGYFAAAMDSMYENRYYRSSKMPHWDFDQLPFPNIPDVHLISRLKALHQVAACIPHPTSWWWEKRGETSKYVTNVCSYLAFGLLAGDLDALTVMGYNSDHYFYQNLWFHILNAGYRMTPVAELDGGYGENNKFPYGLYRVYYKVGDEVSLPGIVKAVRKGQTMVTSGPVIFASIDNEHEVGTELSADGRAHTLSIEAYASSDAEDYLTFLLLFRNGKIHSLWDLRAEKPRQVRREVVISEQERAWYVVKSYGRNTQADPKLLDVMTVCEQIGSGRLSGAVNPNADVCLTAPFYFRPKEDEPSAVFQSQIHLEMVDPHTEKRIEKAVISVEVNGRAIDTIRVEGVAAFTMPVNALLRIQAEGYPTIVRSLYLDYPPHRRLLEKLAAGDWLDQNGWRERMQPGQVPWSAFQFEETIQVLSQVNWVIPLVENERDGAWWAPFNKIFK